MRTKTPTASEVFPTFQSIPWREAATLTHCISQVLRFVRQYPFLSTTEKQEINLQKSENGNTRCWCSYYDSFWCYREKWFCLTFNPFSILKIETKTFVNSFVFWQKNFLNTSNKKLWLQKVLLRWHTKCSASYHLEENCQLNFCSNSEFKRSY